MGCRDYDEHLIEVRQTLGAVILARQLRQSGVDAAAHRVRTIVGAANLDGYWLHVDVDVHDPEHLPAVDSPDPGGLEPEDLIALLAALAPAAMGAQVTISTPTPTAAKRDCGVEDDQDVRGRRLPASARPRPAWSPRHRPAAVTSVSSSSGPRRTASSTAVQ